MVTRTHTPDRINPDGSRTITTQRSCNGCGTTLGDVTSIEWSAAVSGRPLPDVRRECPNCGPTAPEPACYPIGMLAGEAACLEQDCDCPDSYQEYCANVTESQICNTHSRTELVDGVEQIVHSEPWPCRLTPVAAS